jgi:hypothetical protein
MADILRAREVEDRALDLTAITVDQSGGDEIAGDGPRIRLGQPGREPGEPIGPDQGRRVRRGLPALRRRRCAIYD